MSQMKILQLLKDNTDGYFAKEIHIELDLVNCYGQIQKLHKGGLIHFTIELNPQTNRMTYKWVATCPHCKEEKVSEMVCMNGEHRDCENLCEDCYVKMCNEVGV